MPIDGWRLSALVLAIDGLLITNQYQQCHHTGLYCASGICA
jgi:hypothetical protein